MRLSGGEESVPAAQGGFSRKGESAFFGKEKCGACHRPGENDIIEREDDGNLADPSEDRVKRLKGLLVFFVQWIVLLGLYFLLHQLYWFSGPWHGIASWGLMPVMGMISAYMATVRGVNNYLAWPAPPVCAFVAYWLALGYTPEGTGPTLLCALLAIFGAAAGEVVKRGPKRDSQQDSRKQAPRGRE